MSLAQGNNTPTRPRIEPGSPDSESDALTTRPVRPPNGENVVDTKVVRIGMNNARVYSVLYLKYVIEFFQSVEILLM